MNFVDRTLRSKCGQGVDQPEPDESAEDGSGEQWAEKPNASCEHLEAMIQNAKQAFVPTSARIARWNSERLLWGSRKSRPSELERAKMRP